MATAMTNDAGSKLLTWMLFGTGALLLYSAVKNRAPWDVLRNVTGEPIDTPNASSAPAPTSPIPSANPQTVNGGSASDRVRRIAERQMQPTLVPVPGGQLDREAAVSFMRIISELGYVPRNVGMYRSYQTQKELHSREPNRFASPDGSMHVVGLAIDVNANDLGKPGLVAAFERNGWHRYDPTGESWHFSYGVVG